MFGALLCRFRNFKLFLVLIVVWDALNLRLNLLVETPLLYLRIQSSFEPDDDPKGRFIQGKSFSHSLITRYIVVFQIFSFYVLLPSMALCTTSAIRTVHFTTASIPK